MPEYFDILARHETLATKLNNPKLLGAFYVRLAYREWTLGNLLDSIRIATKPANLCEAARNPVEAGVAYGLMAYDYLFMGDFEQVFVMKDRLFKKMEDGFLLHWYERSLQVSVVALSWLGRWGEALDAGQRALRIAQEYSDT